MIALAAIAAALVVFLVVALWHTPTVYDCEHRDAVRKLYRHYPGGRRDQTAWTEARFYCVDCGARVQRNYASQKWEHTNGL